jgi:hypothetical protein
MAEKHLGRWLLGLALLQTALAVLQILILVA